MVSSGPIADYDTQSAVELITTGDAGRRRPRRGPARNRIRSARLQRDPREVDADATSETPPVTTPRTETVADHRRRSGAGATGRDPHARTHARSTFGQYVVAWAKRIRYGESGVLPVVGGLILLVIIFQVQDSVFLSAGNLTNLLVQGSVFILLGMAEVWVLILGEIDLSIGYDAGVGARGHRHPGHVPSTTALVAGHPRRAWLATAAIGALWGVWSPGSACPRSWSPWPACSAWRACSSTWSTPTAPGGPSGSPTTSSTTSSTAT